MIYLLDTNIISYLIRSRDYALIDRFEATAKQARLGVSAITVAELFYGVHKKPAPSWLWRSESFYTRSKSLFLTTQRAWLMANYELI
ncbi:type II toxin-antitoxin system VapC family toxin [Thiomicrorhabdus aquaedulcis]|uniref:type II toxin-antitoxin system VapC family toxin n=1 Tax=Thiomicrorhabdus aquaedulcis TaxID=2211106 RepID=UPI0018D57FD1|nr:type II toxin-antitoxin system VapC family toxin [Thiomicrorhabdus aquaedulcis]